MYGGGGCDVVVLLELNISCNVGGGAAACMVVNILEVTLKSPIEERCWGG